MTSLCPMFWYGDVLRNSQFSRRVYVAHISLFAILLPISSIILPRYFLFFPSLTLLVPPRFLHHSIPLLLFFSFLSSTSAHDLSNPISFHSLRGNPPPKPNQPVAIAHPTTVPPNPTHPNARKPRLPRNSRPHPYPHSINPGYI